jgi:hypothetical protein
MQWKADVDAKLAQLSAQHKSQPNPLELLDAIGARISREGQTLREDFIGKFAASFLLATETITKRVVELDEKQTKLEEREQELETQTTTHEAKVSEDLGKAEAKQAAILATFIDALNQHHRINAATLTKQEVAVEECHRATAATARAAALCTPFAGDYEAIVKKAGTGMDTLTTTLRADLQTFVQGIKKEAPETMVPAIRRAREITEEEYARRTKWIILGGTAILLVCLALTWLVQPTQYVMRDASRWRTYQSELSPDQANRLDKLIDDIQTEQRAVEEKKNR